MAHVTIVRTVLDMAFVNRWSVSQLEVTLVEKGALVQAGSAH